MFKKSLF